MNHDDEVAAEITVRSIKVLTHILKYHYYLSEARSMELSQPQKEYIPSSLVCPKDAGQSLIVLNMTRFMEALRVVNLAFISVI